MAKELKASGVIEIKTSGVDQAIKKLDGLPEVFTSVSKELERVKKTGGLNTLALGSASITKAQRNVSALAIEFVKAQSEIREASNNMKTLEANTAEWIDELERLNQAEATIAQINDEIRRIPQELRESASQTIGFLGDIDSAFQSTAGYLSTLGGGLKGFVGSSPIAGIGDLDEITQKISEIFSIIGETASFLEQLPRFSGALSTLSESTRTWLTNLGRVEQVQKASSEAAVAAAAANEAEVVADSQQAASSGTAAAANEAQALSDQKEAAASVAATAANEAQTVASTTATASATTMTFSLRAAATSLAGIASSAALTVAPLAAIVGVIIAAEKASKEAKKPMDEWLKTFPQVSSELLNIRDVARESTLDQVATVERGEREKQKLIEQQINDLTKFIEESNASIEGRYSGVGKTLLDAAGLDTDEAEEKLRELKTQLKDVTANLDGLNDAYVSSIAAANSYIEAIQAQRDIFIQTQQIIREGTEEQRLASIQGLEDTKAALKAEEALLRARAQNEADPEARKLLEQQANQINLEVQRINQEIGSLESAAVSGATKARQALEDQRSLLELRKTITEEERQERLDALEQEQSLLEEFISSYTQNAEAMSARREEIQDILNAINIGDVEALERLGLSIDQLDPEALYDELVLLDEQLQGGAIAAEQAQQELAKVTDDMEIYNGVLAESAAANDAAAKAAEEAEEAARELASRLEEIPKEINSLSEEIKSITKELEDEAREFNEQRAREEYRNGIVANYEALIKAAEQNEKIAEQEKAIADIRKETHDSIVAEEQSLNADLISIRDEANKEIDELNKEFMKSEIEAIDTFRREEQRNTEDYNRERIRKLQDLSRSLLEAFEENDVRTFIKLREEGLRDVARGDEDESIRSSRANEDFQRARTEAEAAYRESLNQIRFAAQEEARERRIASIQRIQEIRTESIERIAAEREANKEVIKQSEVLRARLDALREKWVVEDEARERAERRTELINRIRDLRDQQRELIAEYRRLGGQELGAKVNLLNAGVQVTSLAANAAKNLLDQFRAFINNSIANVNRIQQQAQQVAPPSKSSSTRQVVRNARGGMYDRPTRIEVGERDGFGDMVIPYSTRDSRGIENALNRVGFRGGSPTINLTIQNVQVGEIVDKQTLKTTLDELQDSLVNGINLAWNMTRS